MTREASLQSLIGSRILTLRAQRVMLDADLAELYDVPTKALVQAVQRNLARFPPDFMFQLSAEEFAGLRSQTVTSSVGRGGRRTAPYAFTEQGVARRRCAGFGARLVQLRDARPVVAGVRRPAGADDAARSAERPIGFVGAPEPKSS